MKILVTGVAGFVGSNLVRRILEVWPDASVVGVDMFNSYYNPALKEANVADLLEHERFTLVRDDLSSMDLGPVVDECEFIFHQAGQAGVRASWGDSFNAYTRDNVAVTQRLLEACKDLPSLRKLVYASSSSVYGEAHAYPTVEDALPGPRSPYGVTKLAAEHLVALYAKNLGLPSVSLRYFTVFGPGQRPDMAFTRFSYWALTGQEIDVYGTGKQMRDFTYVADIVAGNLLAATSPIVDGSPVNLAGGSNASLEEALNLIGEAAGKPLNIRHHAAALGDVTRTGGDINRAQRELGWRPTVGLKEGIAHQVAWMEDRLADGYRLDK